MESSDINVDLTSYVGAQVFDEKASRAFLTSKNWPTGLQNEYIGGLTKCPMRYVIIDDSGSMATRDAVRIVESTDGRNAYEEKTSRWEELVDTIQFHAALANVTKCRTEFRLLNNHPPVIIGDSGSDISNYHALINALSKPFPLITAVLPHPCSIDLRPKLMTPLVRHVNEVVEQITAMAPALRAAGQRVKLIICSDGEASDGNLTTAMRPLRHLPVWIVLRLCTSNDTVAQYWATLDSELELNMDVIQTLLTEANQIHALNPWLNYSEPFHRLRETGLAFKEADLLDELKLTTEQIMNICIFM